MQHSSSLLTPLSSSNRLHKPDLLLRSLAFTVVYATVIFLLNNFLNFWALWPGALNTLGGLPSAGPYAGFGWLQVLSYVSAPMLALLHVSRLQSESYQDLSNRVSNWAATTIKAAFWMVLLVGMVDMLVSFMRIESLLAPIFGDNITSQLGKPQFRGAYVHLPLMLLSCFIAIRSKGLGFIWLALLVVVAEFLIVITRFVFSYEQALCFTILTLGMWDRTSSINSPLLSVEVSQSGYGMYVKYLMVGFLAIFAVSMVIQFSSYLLKHFGVLRGETAITTANP